MLPLPEFPYEMAQWGKAKVQPNCHIAFQRKFYSVPFEYLGEEADVRATQSTVEIFYHHQRIASHKRLWGKADYSTIQEHMPPDKLFFQTGTGPVSFHGREDRMLPERSLRRFWIVQSLSSRLIVPVSVS